MAKQSQSNGHDIGALRSEKLDNGLQVLIQESHVAPVASFWIFYRVGSRNEGPGLTGISHWVEHMLFKGTERYPQGEFDKAVARAGGSFNGMTSQDWTTYFETFPSNRIDLALDVESDRMANAIFDPTESESERTVIISEREGSENSYRWLLSTEMQSVAFNTHTYRHPIIGWKEDLLTIQRDDLYAHYRRFYTPRNGVAVAVGDFDGDEMLARIEDHFGHIPAGPELSNRAPQEPEQISERRVVMRGSDPTAYLQIAFHTPPALHPDFFPLTVLDSILGGAKGMGLFGGSPSNRSNRLYRTLVDTELAVSAGSIYQPTIDPYLLVIRTTLSAGVGHEQVEEAIWKEIERIRSQGVTGAELTKAVQQTKAQFAYSSESVTNQAYWLGFSEVVANSEWFAGWLDSLSQVTTEDVKRVAETYLDRNRPVVGWYIPN